MFVFCAWIIAPNAYPPNSQYSCEKFEKQLASVFQNLYNTPVRGRAVPSAQDFVLSEKQKTNRYKIP